MSEPLDLENIAVADSLLADSWQSIQKTWDDKAAHHEFIGLCDEFDRLDWAARLYADQRKNRPGDPIPREMADQLLLRVALRLQHNRKRKRTPNQKKLRFVLLILLLLIVPLLLLFLFARNPDTRIELQKRLESRIQSDTSPQGDRR